MLAVWSLGIAAPAFAQRKPPYYASIAAEKARIEQEAAAARKLAYDFVRA